MTITAYYPVFFAKDLDEALKRYEALGFQRLHTQDNYAIKTHVLEINENRIDVFSSKSDALQAEDGFYSMRVNVREFDEGLAYYRGLGYEILMGPFDSPSAKLAILADGKGNRVFLFQHHRKEET